VLSFAADFWAAFWTILAVGAAVTAALCFVVAVVPVPGTRRHHRPPARLHPLRLAGTPRADSLPGADRLPRAA
jgi:hypothetical protein